VRAAEQRALARRARERRLDVDPARSVARDGERCPLARRELALAIAVEREHARPRHGHGLAEREAPHALHVHGAEQPG
jgi:hypothetical protein